MGQICKNKHGRCGLARNKSGEDQVVGYKYEQCQKMSISAEEAKARSNNRMNILF